MIVPAAMRARRKLVERFEEAGAVGPDRAIPLAGLSRLERGRLHRFLDANVAHESAPGMYWFDRERYPVYVAHQRRLAVLGFLIVLIVLFFVVEIAGHS
jgi:hypothetical protein